VREELMRVVVGQPWKKEFEWNVQVQKIRGTKVHVTHESTIKYTKKYNII
jgi:hypothetical protein